MSSKKLCIGVDLDDTLCTDKYVSGGIENCQLLDGAREAIHKMRQCGHKVIFFTHRSEEEAVATRQWLYDNEIVYDGIIFEKPHFDLYIGNEAEKFVSWKHMEITEERVMQTQFADGT